MSEIASAYVSLIPSAAGFSKKLNSQIAPGIGRSGTTMGAAFGKSMLKGFLAIGAGVKIAQFLGDSVSEARDANKVAALTANVIKTTGGAAKVSAAQVGRLADALSAKTGIDDEQIASSENLLLTFKSIVREGDGLRNIFARATRASVDLSASGFGSMESTAKQLGKALNDPVKGVAALTRVGVTFTDKQKDQIKTLVASGNALKAQKIILREVESQVKGSAEAQATNADKARVAFGNLKEQIGTALLPALDAMSGLFANKIAPAISGFITNLQSGKGAASGLGGFIRNELLPVLGAQLPKILDGLRDGFAQVRQAIQENKPQLIQIGNAIKKLIPIVGTFAGKWLGYLGFQIRIIIGVLGGAVRAFNVVKSTVQRVGSFVAGAASFFAEFAAGVRQKISNVVSFVKAVPGRIKALFSGLPGELKTIGGNIIGGLVQGIRDAAHFVTDAVQAIINKIPKKIRSLMGIASPSKVTALLGGYIGDGLAKGIAGSAGRVGDAVDKVGKKLKERLASLRDQLATVRSDFASLVEPIASNFTQGLFEFDTASAFTSNLATVKGTLTTLLGNFKTLIADGLAPGFLYQLFQQGGAPLINGLAALPQADALAAGGQFGEVMNLADQLGGNVAGQTQKGAALENQTVRLEHQLKEVNKKLEHLADRVGTAVGREVNGAAANARRRHRRVA